MKKLFPSLFILAMACSAFAQNPDAVINNALSVTTGKGSTETKYTNTYSSLTPMADRLYSLIGTAFYAGDGVTIPYWDYDVDFTYSGKSGNKFYYKIDRQLLLANEQFKVREDHDWVNPGYGFNELTIESPDGFGWLGLNIKVLTRRVYDISFIVDSLNNTFTLSLQYSSPLKRTAVLNKASTPPVINGDIDAVWATANTYNIDVPFLSNGPSLGAKGTTTWKGLWNDNGIYILLQVNDDVFFPAYAGAVPAESWLYDKPEIYFDVNTILQDGLGAKDPNSGHLQVAPGMEADKINGTPVTWAENGVTFAFKVANPSYVAEYFIPFTYLKDKNGVIVPKTALMGFDVTIDDRDSEDTYKQWAVWSNYGLHDESWISMDDCGTITLVGPGANVIVTGITLTSAGNATTISKEAGTLQMTATVIPSGATIKKINWSVINGTGKASVSPTGLLTAIENGTVTVVASATDGSGVTSSKTITISNQYLSFADGSLLKDGGFETDGPIGGFWKTWTGNESSASVVGGVCTMVPKAIGEVYFLQVSQNGWIAYNDTSYNLSFTAWSDVERTFIIDIEDLNNNYARFGASTDPEAIFGRSEWSVPVTSTPTTFTFHLTMDQIKPTTDFNLLIMTANALGTVYIDNISLVSVGYKPYGNGPPVAGTAATGIPVCSGTSAVLDLANHSGIIQWQKSPDGISNWTNVTDGIGADSAHYVTGVLTENSYFRSAVTKPEYSPVFSNVVMVTVNPKPAATGPIAGNTLVCSGQNKKNTYIVQPVANAASYIWELPNGVTGTSTIRSISATFGPAAQSGIITVRGHNNCGDGVASSLPVKLKYPYADEKICMVTIDLETGKNMVVWEKTHNVGIASYNIYREKTDVAGVYDLLGNVKFGDITQFVDLTSQPENRQYLYKISVIDSCGNESAKSNYHKTLFLQYNGSASGVNLTWQEYQIENEVPDFTGYAIYKGNQSTNLTSFTTIASSLKAYTDTDPSALESKTYYRIGGVKPNPCDPAELSGKKASSGPYVHSLSNLEDNRLQSTGIDNSRFENVSSVSVYPTMFTDYTSITYSLVKPSKMRIEIFNVVGEKIGVLLDETQNSGSYKLSLNAEKLNYKAGLYYLRITANDEVFIKKTMLTK